MVFANYDENFNNRFFEIIQKITTETERLQIVIANYGQKKSTSHKKMLSKRHKKLARLKRQKKAQRRILHYLKQLSWR